MSTLPSDKAAPEICLPNVPALCVNAREAVMLSADGELKTLPHAQEQMLVHEPVLVCHAPYTRARLGVEDIKAYDVLELFAFVHPGRFCVPAPHGLAKALGLSEPAGFEDGPFTLTEAVQALLTDLQNKADRKRILDIAGVMGLQGKGWPWTPFVFTALGETYDPARALDSRRALDVWKSLPEWAEEAPEPPPAHHPVTGEEARERLGALLGDGAEKREEQAEYAKIMTAAFAPGGKVFDPPPGLPPSQGGGDVPSGVSPLEGGRLEGGKSPHIVLAEAGTGVGKTLGYLAPASVWAEKNQGAVWISTYTKNLQRQIEQELDRLYPDPDIKESKTAIRKGRENYLCLLNLEDKAVSAALARSPGHAIGAGIMARWVSATKDGDLSGADFPGWLAGILGWQHTLGLADRRGECVYAACDHYHKCFVERSVRKAQRADIVVANHALVMIRTADSGPDTDLPQRYVFDEGHHLFEAADSAFAGHLTARETREMRRWLLGNEGGRGRARGLKRRTEELIAGDSISEAALRQIQGAAMQLAGDGWTKRLKAGMPSGPTENFLFLVYQQVYARADGSDGPYSIETGTWPLIDGLAEASQALKKALKDIYKPLGTLAKELRKKLAEDKGDLSADMRKRIDAVCNSLSLRALNLAAWIAMLETLETGENPEEYVDWMEIERIEGNAVDVGLYRHWVDPMQPFAAALAPHAQGVAITSATLRDGTGDEEEDWRVARERTGTDYLSSAPVQFAVSSPFDYAEQTKVFVLTDVNKNDIGQVAGACQALFEASGGGALGLFTAIQRLRAVHGRIAASLEESGLSLYAQHVDEMDVGTLVDIFRDDTHACLLGTDAVRDGVDVPGESLRLLVYDRVPWPRPTLLHKARREAFGKRRYDELITRLKLKQAYGRLIRRSSDKGVFVMLDSMLPSRLHGAFPEGVDVQRCGLAETVESVREFLEHSR